MKDENEKRKCLLQRRWMSIKERKIREKERQSLGVCSILVTKRDYRIVWGGLLLFVLSFSYSDYLVITLVFQLIVPNSYKLHFKSNLKQWFSK